MGLTWPPVILLLGMDVGVAINLAGGGLENLCPDALGQTEHVDRAVDAGLGGLHRVVLVMDRRGRTGQVVDFIHLDVQRESDVVPHEFETLVLHQRQDIGLGAGEQIIGANDVMPLIEQDLAEVRTEKTGAAGNENAFVLQWFHERPLFRRARR